jgi:hypothetical protein
MFAHPPYRLNSQLFFRKSLEGLRLALSDMLISSIREQADHANDFSLIAPSRLFFLLVVLSFWANKYVLKTVKFRVGYERISFSFSQRALNSFFQNETAFGKRNGCQPAAFVLAYKWPLALDVVKRGFRARRQKKLLSFFTEYFHELGPTVELTILGGTGFATMDPENIEAILSTHFDGSLRGPYSSHGSV